MGIFIWRPVFFWSNQFMFFGKFEITRQKPLEFWTFVSWIQSRDGNLLFHMNRVMASYVRFVFFPLLVFSTISGWNHKYLLRYASHIEPQLSNNYTFESRKIWLYYEHSKDDYSFWHIYNSALFCIIDPFFHAIQWFIPFDICQFTL